jgi:SAM-dependent methyltransferase
MRQRQPKRLLPREVLERPLNRTVTGVASHRIAWAVEILDVAPGDRILEVGCGHGVAVSLICQRLDRGYITALDRSPKMIEMAEKRNAACLDKARFVTASIEGADLGDEIYNKVFAIQVSALHRPGKALDAVGTCLAPGGLLYLFSQAPGWKQPQDADRFGAELGEALQTALFTVEEALVGHVGSGFVSCVVARASR